MDADNRLILIVGAVLVVAVAVPLALWQRHETRRPILSEARIVTATSSDRVFREGTRHVSPDEEIEIALALRVEQPGRDDYWLAPVVHLELDGKAVEHAAVDQWPEDDRMVRVFWFTVECRFMGGKISEDNAAERLHYRTFLAPELGRGLRAEGIPEMHGDDFMGEVENTIQASSGTIRLYARAEVVADPRDVLPVHAASSIGLDLLADPSFPTIHVATDLGQSIRPELGELFRLPGYEPSGDTPELRDQVTVSGLGRTFTTLVAERLVTSSESFAAVAVTGEPRFDEKAVRGLGRLTMSDSAVLRGNRSLRWGEEVRAGDLLVDGGHWMVLVDDDGDGLLGVSDRVAHCWRRPAVVEPLVEALGGSPTPLDLVRWESGGP